MKQKILLLLLGVLTALPALARDFEYTYEGQTITYTVIDENTKTCKTKDGYKDNNEYISGNYITGDLILPEHPKDGDVEFTLTSIGEYAFCKFNTMTSIKIPQSVSYFGRGAFDGCRGLTKVEFASIESLCNMEFYNSYSNPLQYGHNLYIDGKEVKDLVIPETVSSIGKYSFFGCNGLTSVVIPNSVTSIGKDAFRGCSGMTSVVIPNSVTEIGSYAFSGCSGLTSVEIPNSVTEIVSYVFKGCSSLTSVVIPNSVETIGESAFSGCSGLTSVVIPNSVTSIGKSAFEGCSGLTSVVIPNSVTSIGEYTFSGCSGLTSVVIPNSVTSIGEYAFSGCSGMTSVEIPESVTYIGDAAFRNSGLISLTFNAENCTSCGTKSSVFPTTIENLTIGDKVKTIPNYAFYNLEKLTSVEIPNSVASIGEYTFSGCSGLTSVTALPESPAVMNDNSFEGLYDTATLSVPDDGVNKYLATNWSLFKNIQNNSGKDLGSFSDGVLEYRLNPTDMTAMVIGAKSYSNLQIPERFTDDTDAANPVRYYIKGIGYKAFDGQGVNSVEFNSRSQMEYIGDYAFANTKISSIALPETMKTIGNYAFAQTNISSISVPGSVSAIGDYAFYNTYSLSDVILTEGLESIGSYAFSAENERSVTSNPLYLPSTVKSVCIDAFKNFVCSQVDISDLNAWYSIDFGSYLANPLCGTGNGLYVNDEKLTILNVPADIKEIKPYAFYNCKSLEEVTFPEGLEKIGRYSFYSCTNVTEVTIPASVVEIGDKVFGQSKVTFADGLLPISLGESAFSNVRDLYCGRPLESLTLNIDNVTSLGIGNLITEIPDGRFKDLKYLKSLSLGNSVETIGNKAFSGCNKLTDLKFAGELQTVGDEAFSGCTSLAEVILPPSVETIGASAFAGDSKLASIIMGHSVKTIGEKAFDGCKANTVSITAQTPPTAPNNTFSNYTGKLYVQGEKAKDAYYDAFTCWDRFDSYVMIDAEEIKILGIDKISGKAGDTFQLTASVWPENVTLPQIFWRSTNPEIATVDANGLVTLQVDLESLKTRAGGEGDIDGVCTIIAETLYNDGPIAQVGVTAEDTPILVESLTIDPTAWSGEEGSEFTIKATVLPENAEDKTLTFESNDTAVATVDAEGNVKVLKEGTCVITVSTVDGSDLKAECVVTGLAGVEAIFADPSALVDVYDMNGVMLKKDCSREELKQLKPAVYILRSGDTVVKAVVR